MLLLAKINPDKLNRTEEDTISLLPWIGKTAKFIDYHIADHMKEHGIDLSKEIVDDQRSTNEYQKFMELASSENWQEAWAAYLKLPDQIRHAWPAVYQRILIG